MQKLIFTLLLSFSVSVIASAQKWDRQMEVKRMDIQVNTDAFTATTFIEMEFYNPNDAELEGLYKFELQPGQAITAFQLDLFGKYRDGSIEEKWKATNAYNTIVGKRVDPALLTMDYTNHYSLRIYPVPARSSRKITMKINQLLVVKNEAAIYQLPLNISNIIDNLEVGIKVIASSGFPSVIKGLLKEETFGANATGYALSMNSKKVKADKALSFSIPLSAQQPALCLKNSSNKTYFALRFRPGIEKEYKIKPKKVTVFWDISASNAKRNVTREINFLKQYVASNNVEQLTIIPFNQQIQDTAVFYTNKNFNSRWTDYLASLKYEGATQFGVLDFSSVKSDAILLFSDGKNSFGKDMPVAGSTHVYCISSATYAHYTHLKKIIGQSGGEYISLVESTIDDALAKAGKARNIFMGVAAGDTMIRINEDPEASDDELVFLTGSIPVNAKSLRMVYGNNGHVQAEEKIDISDDHFCGGSLVDRIPMLLTFDSYTRANAYWMNALDFGKKEMVVTLNTAFIVLEKLEDYIKFNIMPPKELESQCDMNQFVKADEERRRQFKKLGETEVLRTVAMAYNERINQWDRSQALIAIADVKVEARTEGTKQKTDMVQIDKERSADGYFNLSERREGALTEVVVTALGQQRQPRELGYSVSRVHASELTQAKAVNLQNGLTGKVSGLNVTTVNSGVFGDTRITLRGIRSLTGNNQPMLVLDGVPIRSELLNSINPNDVKDVTILKGPAATAIYGSEGVNGVIVIQTKKGSRGTYSYYWGSYKLKDQDDEDYLVELKDSPYTDKLMKYEQLKKVYGDGAGFYFDVAQHLFEVGYRKEALKVLYSSADIAGGDVQVIKAIGYTLENWKLFDEAAKVYEELIAANEFDFSSYRDLALVYYQAGRYQDAVNTFYEALLKSPDNYEYGRKEIKSAMLYEMNAIIAAHGESLDLAHINKALIKPMTADLRVIAECNTRNFYNEVSVVEPDGRKCSFNSPTGANGRLTSNYYSYAYSYGAAPVEYQVKNAGTGKYKLKIAYVDYSQYANSMKIPTMVKITTFKNFGKKDQSMHVENVIMDNQHGDIEVAEIKW